MTLAGGRYSKFICDRCGMEGNYRERVREKNPNNGMGYLVVHQQCKFIQPRVIQLRPDPTGLRDARPDVMFSSPVYLITDSGLYLVTSDGNYLIMDS